MTEENAADLAFEAANNERYIGALVKKLSLPVHVSTSANEKWLGNTPRSGKSFDSYGPLVGRVGLDAENEDTGRDFYIGARWLSGFDFKVYSWAAPVAAIFFEPGTGGHVLDDHVVVRRSLPSRLDRIVGVHDDWVSEKAKSHSPFAPKPLDVPQAPQGSARSRVSVRTHEKSPPEAEPPKAPTLSPATPTASPTHPAAGPSQPGRSSARPSGSLEEGMRSAEAVKQALRAPRSSALTSVLATLQPDQYRLVTRPANSPLLIQGHPGTGKTIVGIHRAAYLVDEARGSERLNRVLVLGPTDEYERHVVSIVRSLDADSCITIKGLPTWLAEVAGLKHNVVGVQGSLQDEARWVRTLTDRAASICVAQGGWASGPRARVTNLERLYGVLKTNGTTSERITDGRDGAPWLGSLPAVGSAIRARRYLPLFAAASLSILGRPETAFDHIIVDETQDVSGLEWEIIRQHNPSGSWTLLGDMNQRRTDYGDATWQALSRRLGLSDEDSPIGHEVIERGYRSTQAILDFARRLLPRGERTARSLQTDGPPPKVVRATKVAERDSTAVAEAALLLTRHDGGTVAIIAVDPLGVEPVLQRAGWRRGRFQGDWQRGKRELFLRTPETARGVEFDAVVVVEPSAFPKNLGRLGPLYTSLTRANRELVVVHHAALPDELRRYERR